MKQQRLTLLELPSAMKLSLIALLGLSMSAAAQDAIVSQAYEIPLAEFRGPVTPNGATTFRECTDCEAHYLRVTADTRYQLNGRAVRFDTFREALKRIRDRENTVVVLLHYLETDTVVSIDVPVDTEQLERDQTGERGNTGLGPSS